MPALAPWWERERFFRVRPPRQANQEDVYNGYNGNGGQNQRLVKVEICTGHGICQSLEKDYINWLKQQWIGPVYIDLTGRSDVSEVLCSVHRASHCLVDLVDFICGSGTVRKKIVWQQRGNARGATLGDFFHVEKTMAQSKSPEFGTVQRLRALMTRVMACLWRTSNLLRPLWGYSARKKFMQAFGSSKLRDAVPDFSDNSWFQVDP